MVFDSLSGGTVVGLDKRRSFVITVIVFGHRSAIYIYVHVLLLFIELQSIPPRYLFIYVSKLNFIKINAYEMFPVFFLTPAIKNYPRKISKS